MIKTNFKIFALLLMMAVSMAVGDECAAQYEKMKAGRYGIEELYPIGKNQVAGSIWMEVENPYCELRVSDVFCRVYKDGEPFIEGYADDFVVSAGESKVVVTGSASLCEGVALVEVLQLLVFDPKMYSVDMRMNVTDVSGRTQILEHKKRPVSDLLKVSKL